MGGGRLGGVAAIAWLLGCTPASVDAPPEVSVEVAPATPTVPVLRWDAAAGAVRAVTDSGSFETAVGDPRVGIPVFGLKAARDARLEVLDGDRVVAALDWSGPDVPASLSLVTVTGDPEASALPDRGGVLMAITAEFDSFVALLDADGDWLWWTLADADMTTASPRPTLDGSGVLFAQHDRGRVVDRSIVTRLRWDGTERVDVRTPTGHHMAAELPDGRIAYLGHTARDADLGSGPAPLLSDTIAIADPASDDVEVVFDYFDALEPYAPCPHAAATVDKFEWTDIAEWTHSNSLVHDADAGLFYVMSWHMDALLAVDAATGERVWQVGGRDATRPFAGPYDAFDHAHTSYVDSDTLWVFDNRVIEGGTSRLVRYDLTEDPVRAVWSVPEATGRNIGFLGDFRPGPQGRSFGAWTVPGDVTEHDAQGIEVWRAKLGRGPVLGRIGVVELPR